MSSRTPPATAEAAGTYVALLRGINVGGNNKLPMRDLAALCVRAGARDVQTYIQSGNVVLRATPAVAAALPGELATRIASALGLRVPVILRSADELARVVAGNPFLPPGADSGALHVMFLADEPTAAAVAGLDPARSPPDEFRVVGRDVYVRLAHGVAKTKLTNAYFDARLSTTSTMRNWRTVLKLLEMAAPGT